MDETHDEVDNNKDLDPRIQDELNLLNTSSNDINRLENEIDEARAKYRSTFADASHKMEIQGKELKKYIQRARQFYQLKEAAVKAQSEALRAARQYQTANGIYRAAKETIALAEQKLMDDQSAAMLSSAWQEMLNHATIRVMEAEREKTRSEEEHLRRSSIFASLESKLQYLEKKFKKSIAKSRPYFEMKAQLELKLQQQKQNIDDLQNAIKSSKIQYSESLKRLEDISEEIHESRRQKILLMFPREPGVGADNESLASTISDPNIERGLFSTSSAADCHVFSDVDDGDDVFSSDSTATNDSRRLSGVSLPELSRELPVCENQEKPGVSDTNKDTLNKAENSSAAELEINASPPVVNLIKTNVEKQTVVNGVGESDLQLTTEGKTMRSRSRDHLNPVGGGVSVPEVRQCGNGAEQSPVLCDDGQRVEKVTGCDVTLPERDENQTEGSSDPEECSKDLKDVDNVQKYGSVVEATAIL